MDADLENHIENIEKLVVQNNRMLIRMRHAQRTAAAFRFLYWIIIIGLTIAAYYYVQPYITAVKSDVSSAQGTISNLKNLGGYFNTASQTTSQ